ncbi:Macrophage mannose receptor 1, partial [Stegodyphus mimosarum]
MVMIWLAFILTVALHQVSSSTLSEREDKSANSQPLDKKEVLSSCNKGWFPFEDKCYRIGGRKRIGKLSWEKASQRCIDYGGHLVTIHSKEQQDFIRTFLLLSVRENVWIGLHDRINESLYEWADGSSVNYKNWEPMEPTGITNEKEDCVEMVFRSFKQHGETGHWNDIDCNNEKLFICETKKDKNTKKNLDPRFCPVEQGGGWKFENSCYNVISKAKCWLDAEEECNRNYEGHLVTITDFAVTLFLDYILRNYTKSVWIGIQIKEEFQQQWSSGWYVAYEAWAEDKGDFTEETCAIRALNGKWTTVSCKKEFGFICEVTSANPSVLKPPLLENSFCPEEPDEWRDLGGERCYYFDTKSAVTWYEANFICMRRGGTLVSIHSQEEVDVLHQFVRYTQFSLHIGLYRHMQYDEEFVWADGSNFDFTFWDADEPNSEDEKCVEMLTGTMEWNDISCQQKRGFICSMPKMAPNDTHQDEKQIEDCKGGFSATTLIGVILCIMLVVALLCILAYYFRPCDREQDPAKKASVVTLQTPPGLSKTPRYRSAE